MADLSPPKTMEPSDRDSPQDVILRIRKEHMENIEKGKKNYEYRAYHLHEEVKRVWLYEDESSNIRLVLVIGRVKMPGQVNNSEGVGNNKFDRGEKESKFRYPILEVYRLPHPLTKGELLNGYDVDMNGGHQYAKQKLIDAFPLASAEKVIPKM